jgi:hypothetical protein
MPVGLCELSYMPRTAEEEGEEGEGEEGEGEGEGADADGDADAGAIGIADAAGVVSAGLADSRGLLPRVRRMGTVAMSKPFIESGVPAKAPPPELPPAVCRPVAIAESLAVTGVRRVKAAVPSATRKAAKTAAYCQLVLGDFDRRFACVPRAISRNHNGPASSMPADSFTWCSIAQMMAVLGVPRSPSGGVA